MRHLLLALAALVPSLLAAGDCLAESKTTDESRKLTPQEAIERSQGALGEKLAAFTLTDSKGNRISTEDFRGKPLVVNIVYTACNTVCPLMTQHLYEAVVQAQDVIGADRFNILTLGFDATNDTPQRLSQFAADNDIQLPNWHFASGDKGTMLAILRNLGFSYASVAGGFDHIAQTTIVDVDGTIYRHVYGDDFPIQVFIEPLKDTAFGFKREITLTGLIDRFRFFCTSFDPTIGRYRTRYAEAIAGMVLGALSLVVMGALIMREWRKSHSV